MSESAGSGGGRDGRRRCDGGCGAVPSLESGASLRTGSFI